MAFGIRGMTWNIHTNVGQSPPNPPALTKNGHIADTINNQDPDIIALQEVCYGALRQVINSLGTKQINGVTWARRGLGAESGNGIYFSHRAEIQGSQHGDCGVYYDPNDAHNLAFGNAILSRVPLLQPAAYTVLTPPYPQLIMGIGLQHSAITIPFNFWCTHLGGGALTRPRPDQADVAIEYLAGFSSRKIIGGDMNVWPAYSGHTQSEGYPRLQQTFYANYNECDPRTPPAGTAPSGAKLDYLFFTKDLVTASDPSAPPVDQFATSDHYPLVANFKVQ